jgi:hypothetical protein
MRSSSLRSLSAHAHAVDVSARAQAEPPATSNDMSHFSAAPMHVGDAGGVAGVAGSGGDGSGFGASSGGAYNAHCGALWDRPASSEWVGTVLRDRHGVQPLRDAVEADGFTEDLAAIFEKASLIDS